MELDHGSNVIVEHPKIFTNGNFKDLDFIVQILKDRQNVGL